MDDGATLLKEVLTMPLQGGNAPPPQQQPPQKTPNELQRDALTQRWSALLQDIGTSQRKLLDGGRSPGIQELTLRDAQANVHKLLDVPAFKNASSDQTFQLAYDAAKTAIDQFETSGTATFFAQQVRNNEAAALLKDANQAGTTLDAEATQTDKGEVTQAIQNLTLSLAAPVSAQALLTGADTLKSLKEKIATIGKRCEEDRNRRIQERKALLERVGKAPADPKATQREKDDLATLAKPVTGLPEVPTAQQLLDANLAAESVEREAKAIRQRVEERTKRFEKAAPLLQRLAPNAPGLTAHARAAATETKPILDDAAKLLQQSSKFTDWAQVHTWDDKALEELEKAIAALETRMADLTKLVLARIEKVDEAVARATNAIDNATDRPFSQAQKTHLKGLITPHIDQFAQDGAKADAVALELDKIAASTSALSRMLASLAKRIAAVIVPPDTDLSPKEKDALKKARDDATKALDEVTEV